ncbi:TetR/AcrR family transcriptional regulator [Kutzneria viridogrisea]|uniref:TetR family transcription regulator n=2 Tax=Kutzneria TaxID=43356 RepID=W5W5J1_9PSEU|nr:TetR family transcriptional regulator [Kutzneria albida]AHH96045.1 TetR family transcription regulator [Kutzneria albida DSM 43870]MBA8928751.1 AcrR family transcriptional regulator [Kutzneria viridogrisea]
MAPELTRQRQADRSRETRRKLMEATVECLVAHGWSGTTTTAVAELAGVSRGAQLHHFRTRNELVTAAVEHVGAQSAEQLLARADAVRARPDRTRAVVELIADFYASPMFTAALELWVAARTDPDLKQVVVALEVRLGRECHRLAVDLLGADESRAGVREAVQATLDLARGLALANQLTDDSRRRAKIVRRWAAMLDSALVEERS